MVTSWNRSERAEGKAHGTQEPECIEYTGHFSALTIFGNA